MRAVRLKAGLFTFGMLATSVATASVGLAAPADSAIAAQDLTNVSTNRVVVYHSPFVQPSSKTLAAATHSRAQVLRRYSVTSSVVSLGESLSGDDLAAAMEAIDATPGVIKVEPSIRMKAFDVTPNDSYIGDAGMWYLKSSNSYPGATNLTTAWSSTSGNNEAVVAVLDTGYTTHEDFDSSRIVAQADFVGADEPGVFVSANDGDGWDTNAHDPGDSISQADSDYFATIPIDCPVSESSWHGTHVSGIIAATPNNNTGVSGIDWNAKIVEVRVLGECGGADLEIAAGIRWAAGLHVDGMPDNSYPADVINMSLGGPSPCLQQTQDAINDAVAAGSTVVVAAGNEDMDTAEISPANCDNVITVGAITSGGKRSTFSNYGDEVDVMAPGVNILNNVNGGATGPTTSEYAYMDGTSMATPVVSGIIALTQGQRYAASAAPYSPAEVESRLKSVARAFPLGTGAYNCTVASHNCGAGIIDAVGMVGGVTPANAPKVSVVKTDLQIKFMQSPSAHHYIVKRGTTTINSSVLPAATVAQTFVDSKRATFAGTYNYQVIAVDDRGVQSPASTITFAVKVPPQPVIVATGGSRKITINAAIQASTPAAKTWCIYVDSVLAKCLGAGTRTTSVSVSTGIHSLYVRSSTLKGTSAPSNVVRAYAS